MQDQNALLQRAASVLRTPVSELPERIALAQEQIKALEKELDQMRSKLAANAGNDLADKAAIEIKGVKVLAAIVADTDPKALRGMVDNLKDKLKSGVVLLATSVDGKISVVGGVTADLTGKVKAGDLVGYVAGRIGGKGGGRPDMAMGGGTDVAALADAVASVQGWVHERL
ncbi:alanyl-tRNA synthetase [Bordetella trematum]|nr:alanyl-tRNA synthetase [Bordetella trematum]